MRKTSAFILTTALSLPLVVLAQQANPPNTTPTPPPSTLPSSPSSSAGSSTMSSVAMSSSNFAKAALASGKKEISAWQQVRSSTSDGELREMADMVIRDHTQANQRLSTIAQGKGWSVDADATASGSTIGGMSPAGSSDSSMSQDANNANNDVSTSGSASNSSTTSSSGADPQFIAQQISAHERSVAIYRHQAQSGDDTEIKAFARDTLPKLEMHLTELRRMQA